VSRGGEDEKGRRDMKRNRGGKESALMSRRAVHTPTSTTTMESLRSKASARKGPKPAAKLSKPDKNARKSRVDDKIKKRMSMRYAISSPTPADAAPSVPTIPLGLRGPDLDIIREKDEVAQQHAPSKEDLRAMENRLLDVEEFDPDACACVDFNPSILLLK
jgi:hypothetical protein